jgi:hypothetical protein
MRLSAGDRPANIEERSDKRPGNLPQLAVFALFCILALSIALNYELNGSDAATPATGRRGVTPTAAAIAAGQQNATPSAAQVPTPTSSAAPTAATGSTMQPTATVEPTPTAGAESAFAQLWARTDQPAHDRRVDRTWMWGPEPITGVLKEPYADSPGGNRLVVYYDKARMEINDTSAEADDLWYVSNGLLVAEMITGKMQIGSDAFEEREPPDTSVAGDPGSIAGPTYQTIGLIVDEPAREIGSPVEESINRAGTIVRNPSLSKAGVTNVYYVPETQHTIASPFWEFMNSTGLVQGDDVQQERLFEDPFYATGLPVTEAYWTVVKVGGANSVVLLQCFERRCLTYTPSNDDGWQVEAGNVGLHYYEWRYGKAPSLQTP